mgnify:CR=1 FL=1
MFSLNCDIWIAITKLVIPDIEDGGMYVKIVHLE